MQRTGKTNPEGTPSTQELTRVLQEEDRLAAQLALAEEEGRKLVEQARQQAEALQRNEAEALAAALAAVRSAEEADRGAQIGNVREALAREATRYTRVTEDQLSAMAESVVRRLVEPDPGEATP